MGKKLQEHSSVVQPRKATEAGPTDYDASGRLQAVKGGGKKRIVFEEPVRDEPAEETPIPAPRTVPRGYGADIHTIERDVDNLYAWRSRIPLHTRRRFLETERPTSRTVYRSDGGYVEASRNSDHGETLYVTSKEAGRDVDRRFVSSMVDRLLAKKGALSEQEYQIVRQPETRRRVTEIKTVTKDGVKHTEKTVTEDGVLREQVATDEPWTPDAKATKPAKAAKPAKTAKKPAKAAKKPAKAAAAKKPAKAEPEKPAKLSFPSMDGQPQCAALTKAGGQCRNSARMKSKYCGAHKGYRPPTKAQLLARLDTKPRHSKAEDTKPTVN